MPVKKGFYIIPIVVLIFFSCASDKKKEALVLFEDYCASCHLAPSIQSLPKHLWANKVLPEMGARMGIRDSAFNPYEGLSYDEYEAVLKTGLYTPSPIIQKKEWNLLKDYIIQQAPDSLVMPNVDITNKSLNAFVPKPISIDAISSALFTYLNVDKGTGEIKLGDMKGMLSTYNFVKDTLIIDGNFNRPITANDGDNDIITVHGDNADKTYTLKPYHGMRLHINDGKNRFEEKYFYPMNGATRLVSRDFDQDRDLDFGLLSTFPNYENPKESSFVYHENKNTATFEFEDFTFKESNFARWLLMDADDVDGDGDEDIVLSSFSYQFTPVPEERTNFWNEKGTDLMISENKFN